MNEPKDPEAAETVQTESIKAVDPAAICSAFRASVKDAVRAALWNFERSGYTPEELADEIGYLLRENGMTHAMRMAEEIDRLKDAVKWALGESGDFGPRPKGTGSYWWRNELRQRAGILPNMEAWQPATEKQDGN